jgi:hypothetical protein
MPDPWSPAAPSPSNAASTEGPSGAPPRLGLAHLFVFIACTGAALALQRSFLDFLSKEADFRGYVQIGLSLCHAPVTGAAWTGLAVLVFRLFRGPRWNWAPGDWILASVGLGMLLHSAFDLLLRWVAVPERYGNYVGLLNSAVYFSASMFTLVIGVLLLQRQVAWRLLLIALGLAQLPSLIFFAVITVRGGFDFWQTLFAVRSVFVMVVHVFLALGIFFCVALDARNGERRAWTHWLGIAVALAESAFSIAWSVVNLVMR